MADESRWAPVPLQTRFVGHLLTAVVLWLLTVVVAWVLLTVAGLPRLSFAESVWIYAAEFPAQLVASLLEDRLVRRRRRYFAGSVPVAVSSIVARAGTRTLRRQIRRDICDHAQEVKKRRERKK
ncbi:hypothetical protein J2S49_000913 [Arcanobacterium wilhelmae]|uniref:Uncharacterized protein n=1 Tax=Arcanobacterium wilhelmae TaxID=1803177 RepID=A0ABT9NAX9_9ACTO|nr:hypothetical protein [Arcanobacterium wilhelmae]MDP9800837.1 hypothetical protein [Arcanobacterium wilhelmae]WFN90211.1 hypothetical protein P8A24_08505 [Arcanobacterium wilhelmae]